MWLGECKGRWERAEEGLEPEGRLVTREGMSKGRHGTKLLLLIVLRTAKERA